MPGSRAVVFAVVYAAGLALPCLATTVERVTYMKSWKVPQADNPHGEPVSETVKRRRRRMQETFACGPTSTSSSSTTPSPTKAPATPATTPAPDHPTTPAPVTAAPSTKPPVTARPTPSPIPKPPTAAPADPPTPAPVDPPTPAPVEPATPGPVDSPTPAPVDPPTPAPVDPPTPAPVDPPTPAPVDPPTPAPVDPPTPAPVDPPTAPPVTPPTEPPVAPPTEPPVAPTTPGTSDCAGGNPCENGGSCSADPAGGYRCSCAAGYAGMHCQTSTGGLPQWKIELNYNGDFNDARKRIFQQAAERWRTVIPFVPGGGAPGLTAGVLTIDCNLKSIDGPGGVLGSAGPTGVWDEYRGISYSGSMDFDTGDIQQMEDNGSLLGVITHEMGHVIGVGTLWDQAGVDCSGCRGNGSPNWQCPAAAEVYAQLADSGGSAAPIIETEGGTGTACGHFNENMFDNELMTGFVTNADMPLSKLTCASLEDIGYVVMASATDDYTIPSKRPPNAVAPGTPKEIKTELEDSMSWDTLKIAKSDGTIEEEDFPGIRARF